jgi:ribonuclease HI
LEYALRLNFPATNNVSEYEALLAGMKRARQLGVKRLKAHTDSKLVAEQVSGEFAARDDNIAAYLAKVRALEAKFDYFVAQHVPREENMMADALSKLASSAADRAPCTIYFEELEKPATEDIEVLCTTEGETWMTPLVKFLTTGAMPEDKKAAEKLKRRAAHYVMIGDDLYRKSLSMPYLKCVNEGLGLKVLEEIHEGICSSHIGARTLAQKAFRQGYYWPTLMEDAKSYVCRYEKCQGMRRSTTCRPSQSAASLPLGLLYSGEST